MSAMEENPYPGEFIAFEGIDGGGKTTQARKLFHYLKTHKLQGGIVYTKEPTYEMPAGNELRKALREETKTTPAKLQELFVKDRDIHLHYFILPKLGQGQTVICDRYFFSTVAYGSIDLKIDKLIGLNADIRNFILPDITFIFDVEPKLGLQRRKQDSELDMFEQEEKLNKVRETYKKLAGRFDDVVTIDGSRKEDDIFEEILHHVNKVLLRRMVPVPLLKKQQEEWARI